MLLVPVGPLLAVFRLLTGGSAAVRTSDIMLLLGLGLHLSVILGPVTAASETDAVLQDMLKIVHNQNV